MTPLRKKDLVWIACLVLSGAITYFSLRIGMERGYSGQPVLIWAHALSFLVAVALVVMAIIFKSKQ